MDYLKKYLQDNINELNAHEPSDKLLQNIIDKLPQNDYLKNTIIHNIDTFYNEPPVLELFENIWAGTHKDDLKDKIQANINDFNLQTPNDELFENIFSNLPIKKQKGILYKMPNFYKYATAACISSFVMFFIGKNLYKENNYPNDNQLAVMDKSINTTIPENNITKFENKIIEKEFPTLKLVAPPIINTEKDVKNNSIINEIKTNKNTLQNTDESKLKKEKNTIITFDNSEAIKIVEDFSASYSPLLVSQIKRIESTPLNAEGPEYYQSFKQQWRELDNDEKIFKAQINKFGLTEIGIQPLMNIYQSKLNLLNSLQIEITKTNNKFHKNKSVIDSVQTAKYITL